MAEFLTLLRAGDGAEVHLRGSAIVAVLPVCADPFPVDENTTPTNCHVFLACDPEPVQLFTSVHDVLTKLGEIDA